jgi:hypothetical protein
MCLLGAARVGRADRAAVPDMEDGVAREACAQRLDVVEPLPVEAVGEEAVPVVVDLIAEKTIRSSSPSTHGLSCGDSLGPRSVDRLRC